ncbi:MerR family transcriptional regulator [Dactylosporangium sp. NBC_01737]|uniref:MerR family transcriptional regulator n=1 Tax=Dactylosporangium sp. NBC_01737 TaxID=2975959 RepID=UPI002E133CCD|nr:MerR family transcriptional regulator [Dactylosporangium sp. NBC_01737]
MSDERHLLTIGQLADYAGVTIKAVRHYHARGLLPEPPRDASGYRRYNARHAIQLVKVKTLADAGVPLARVKELLTAGAEEFAAAIAEIDRDLRRQAEKIRRSRDRIAQLRNGDRLFVAAEVATYLERLQGLGISERTVHLERDLWLLLHAVSPKDADGWIADKLDALDDPEFQAIYLAYDAAFDLPPDDPGLPALAARARRWYTMRYQATESAGDVDPAISQLAAASVGASSPAWTRLAELARPATADR